MEKKPSHEFRPSDRVTRSVQTYFRFLNGHFESERRTRSYSRHKVGRLLEDYMQEELELPDADSARIQRVIDTSGVLADPSNLKGGELEAEERAYLAPFTLLLPYIESKYVLGEEYSLEEVSLWVKTVAQNCFSGMGMHHGSQECLAGESWTHESPCECDESTICPMKELRQLLTYPATHSETLGLDEMLGGDRWVNLTIEKLEIAHRLGLINHDEYDNFINLYDAKVNGLGSHD